ncbi:AsmA family protein [Oryzicola mucosus]|uniref:AsmA family protein n=1 Tax=Oryzicola mucosus TaxID=2767425 RepID=A0A8J6PT42_9HYPH|nr:AsmA-like C-terminal region-containing protein [Oryzicola mucosus]MBD0414749.1 AsmA family protein [Oryzicola mucosus]
MLARLFVFFGGLFVLALLAALVGPLFINWTNYKADFEAEASTILGRPVTVEGISSARLLPFPSVTFSNVSVAGIGDGKPAMTVETFSMDAELAPFMRGEFLIFDMRLERPTATIRVDKDGVIDWSIRPSTRFDPKQVAIEKLTITDGTLVVERGASGASHTLSGINADVSAKSIAGPWRLDGVFGLDGRGMTLSASTGTVGDDGQMRVRLRTQAYGSPFTIETDGNAGLTEGAGRYAGTFRVLTAVDAEKASAAASKSKSDDPGMRLSGDFALRHDDLAISAFRFETGPLDNPYTADGSADIKLGAEPSFAVTAKGAQVRFDEAVGGDRGSALTIPQRLDALERTLVGLPQPSIPGTVEVSLPAVVAGDTTVRDVRLSAEPTDGGWLIKSAAATLPGRTTLEADGYLSTGAGIGFKGNLLLAVAQPSGFAAWVSSDINEAIRRLPAAGFSANVDMTRAKQSFKNAELILGDAKFTGELESAEGGDARPSMSLQLRGNALDLDGLRAFSSLFVTEDGLNRFGERDLDFDIVAGPVTVGGMTADTLDTALRLREGVVEIDRLSIGGLGASLSATGRVSDFASAPTGNIDASLVAVDLAPLIKLGAAQFPDNRPLQELASRAEAHGDLFTDAHLDVVASVAGNDDGSTGLALSGQGEAGGSKFSVTLSGEGDRAAPRDAPLTFSLTASNDDATQLLALVGLQTLPLGMTGRGAVDLNAKGTLTEGLSTTAAFRGDGITADFDGSAGFGEQGPTIRGKVTLEAEDIEPWLMTTGLGLPGMGVGTALNLTTEADYGNGLLVLNELNGAVNEASVAGDVNLTAADGLPKLSGALQLDELDMAPFAAMLLGDQIRGTDQAARETPFSQKSVAPFAADLDISAGTLSLGTAATAYDARLSLVVSPQALRVSDVTATLFDGKLTGLAEIKNEGGTGLLATQFSLDGVDLQSALADSGLNGTGKLTASLTASGKTLDGLFASLSGSGTAALGDIVIDRLNPDAFKGFIASADAVGRDIDGARVAEFAPSIATDGRFAAKPVDVAFTVAGGVLRIPPVTLENASAALSADLRADLAQGTIASSGTISYQPGDEAIPGSEPSLRFTLEGSLVDTERLFDTEPLAQFLTQRALEKEQARVEAMQAELLEKQRLRREVRYFTELDAQRKRAAEEAARREEEARIRAEEEARAKAEAEAKAKADAEAKALEERRIAEEARLAAEAKAEETRRAAEAKAEEQRRAAEAKAAAEKDEQEQIDRAPQPTPSPQQPPVAPLKLDGLF